ncbi:MAG: ribonuclease Y [Candidatus Yanofskybacteria bacterium RIFCSPHIGHO2_02_FULL_41_29]|uniref:Ribonuclease Y n=1 Tax=Candidatus Yanofskybacteria bacterium RIFCSPHIGHO2_01_FULL_41_53 TaxID=1802663 RepID=A0A1F8EFT2_9BACT|nr:MAG: ribonuclease Y [Candidatus Yanofskybacteria bacterium RIFCSPHIGHO2_01_FULL_41_53]OGN11049.1 MAG: ribonuclease Y [Candidatus Yanofskybacteria bacterium RIFCSPHIGHO2_02_FULL_41_29]OGN19064.1 MAG: ribonuclease Y [Candidatus Yanofskybacteria bacterium RIFCSPHIGHO2_12_FULL_41_9]OGN21966.1 MAG: ribonuclease Y [Candidatus Yanofskybacteria bacterium RIFCSPLOWO2_01_FULL_41_67]OGN30241.1 MAG: ribonuclease Y [Candidatus Yanofskybacteria bacterium RIFCSPLOWO2_02_FULL_41_13]OGN33785.1 MAG: ribonucl
MLSNLNPLIAAISALLPGLIIGYLVRQVLSSRKASQAEAKAEAILNESKSKAQDILLEAKNRALETLEEVKKEEKERSSQLSRIENLLTKKENELESRDKELRIDKASLVSKGQELVVLKSELEKNRQKQIQELERVASLNKEQAKAELFRKAEEEAKDELYKKIIRLEQDNKEELDKKAREILTLAVQRYAASQIADTVSTIVTLPSDELKGKIIGKEGRNIKTIERLTGVDIIIDDTPEALVISGFDPVRRQIAKLALDKLIADGRIHPAKIEEMVEKAKAEINDKIKEAGEAALFETGIGAVDPRLAYFLGRLAFRTSFGQNVLLHSIEMAHIAGMIAAELGADVSVAKKGALFHDVGKAVDHEVQGTHVEIGRKILQKFGMDERVIRAMEAHHEEYPYATLESRIVQAADAISGARPGARKDTVEIYLKRLEDLERISNSFDGVEKSYAIQAGRELRIFVTPTAIDDLGALKMAKDIAKKIEDEMKYPGEIKVNVIRETRAVEYAR